MTRTSISWSLNLNKLLYVYSYWMLESSLCESSRTSITIWEKTICFIFFARRTYFSKKYFQMLSRDCWDRIHQETAWKQTFESGYLLSEMRTESYTHIVRENYSSGMHVTMTISSGCRVFLFRHLFSFSFVWFLPYFGSSLVIPFKTNKCRNSSANNNKSNCGITFECRI